VSVDAPQHGPELFFGIAGAVGTDLAMVTEQLADLLELRGYHPAVVQLSGLLKDNLDWSKATKHPAFDETTHDRHIRTYMDAGDDLRELTSRGDAMALLSILEIARSRQDAMTPEPRTAYILRSLKHPAEVDSLRAVYGPNFFLISAYAPVDVRAHNLENRIDRDWARIGYESADESPAGTAYNLIQRDMREADRRLGQRLADTFAKADFFVDARDQTQLRPDLQRFIELLFNHPFHTPTRHENAMFHAHAASLRSSAPGRQVGCAITSPEGDVIALGTNEVPKAGGGQYWPGDDPDKRDHEHHEPDVSGSHKRTVIEQILRRMRDRGWLDPSRANASPDEFADALKGLRVHSLIEFERVVHAEMSAITLAARTQISTQDTFLYSTTFPCHECTRHLVAAGVRRVFYIEPYPKSLASDLHPDSIVIDPINPPADRVSFLPFVGVAPRRYIELFTPTENSRKDESGRIRKKLAGWLPKGVPSSPPEGGEQPEIPGFASNQGVDQTALGVETVQKSAFESQPEGTEILSEVEAADVTEESGVALDVTSGRPEHTSDSLYIVREGNFLVELEEMLKASGIEAKEVAGD
jgi:deoxycytidylate deaminase